MSPYERDCYGADIQPALNMSMKTLVPLDAAEESSFMFSTFEAYGWLGSGFLHGELLLYSSQMGFWMRQNHDQSLASITLTGIGASPIMADGRLTIGGAIKTS